MGAKVLLKSIEMTETGNISSQILTSLGVGSGIDVVELAENLTNAVREPKQQAIQEKIDATEASLSAYGVISYHLGQLKASFEKLNDASELATSTGTSSLPSAVNFTALMGSAETGSYDISISQLAQQQRSISHQYSSSSLSLNGGNSFDIILTKGNTVTSSSTIGVTADTPAGVVSAINAADVGVTATLIDTGIAGANYRIVLSGTSGSEGVFSVASTPDLGFATSGNTIQTAQDSQFSINGLSIDRPSNEIADVIAGATFNLNSITTSSVRLSVSSDKTTLKTNLVNALDAYNNLNEALHELTTSVVDEDVEFSGALQREQSTTRYVKQRVYDTIMGDSSTASGSLVALRDVGVSVATDGSLTFNETTFETAVAAHYDDVVMMLSAGTSDQSLYDGNSQGLAQDVVTVLKDLTHSDGIVTRRSASVANYLDDYAQELARLEVRMDAMYQRYLTQFASMDSLLEQFDSTREYLDGQLESLSNIYNND